MLKRDLLKKVYYGTFMLLFILSGCKKSMGLMNSKELSEQDLLDLVYGEKSGNKLDMYLPGNRTKDTRIIILIHGGSWFEGDKANLKELAEYFRSRGYACATINYRLTNTPANNIHPAQVIDIAEAIDFISYNASQWTISSDKFALLGVSAGAHLALLYTYAYNTGDKIKSVIGMAAPSDFTNPQNGTPQQIQVIKWLIGSSFQSDPISYQQASPISHISKSSSPTLLFHGKLDLSVPYTQSVNLKNQLDQFNIPNKLILYEDTGHEVLNIKNTSTFLTECENWFKSYLK